MRTKFIEATNVGGFNYGKFLVQQFEDKDWEYASALDTTPSELCATGRRSLLAARGWSTSHIMVTDIQTGEGAIFRHGGFAAADLHKHKIWVCPLFEPFLVWLYRQDVSDLDKLPALVKLDTPEGGMQGYRRAGPGDEARQHAIALEQCATFAENDLGGQVGPAMRDAAKFLRELSGSETC